MKSLILICSIALLGYACDSKQSEANSEPKKEKVEVDTTQLTEPSEELLIESVSTAFQFPAFRDLTDDFFIDTLRQSFLEGQASFHYNYCAHITDTTFNDLIVEAIQANIDYEMSFIETDLTPNTNYSMTCKPVHMYVNDEIISVQQVQDSYTEGGNHHNYDWLSFNYDRQNQSFLDFKDVFTINRMQEKEAFIALLESYNPSSCLGCDISIDFDEDMYFVFKEDSVVFMRQPQWACGMPVTAVPNEALAPFSKQF